jgi:predicted glycosyltransferase
LSPEIAAKLEYAGYMSESVPASQIHSARAERGVAMDTKWIVCSAGGGALGESLVQELLRISDTLPGVAIDVVQGPHSELPWPSLLTSTIERGRIRVHRECRTLPLLHAAADLVVCPAGYNSLVEVMEGGAPIITVSVQPDTDGEQFLLASRLAKRYPIAVLSEYHQLSKLIRDTLDLHRGRVPIRQTGRLNFNGLQNARDLILSCVKRCAENGPNHQNRWA